VPVALADGLDIKLNTAVQRITYGLNGVEVSTSNPRTNTTGQVYEGNILHNTIPISELFLVKLKYKYVYIYYIICDI
jgi:lysine-specific histone demethylase 1